MDDLYDEDFEDVVSSEVEQLKIPDVTESKNEYDEPESNRNDDDFYSAAPSSAIEPLGTEATIASDQYDDDFYSPNPSAVLDQGSSVSAAEPNTPIQTVQRLSNSFSADLINNAIDASSKILPNSVVRETESSNAPVIKSGSWDEAEAAADEFIEPLKDASPIETEYKTEESVFYEDDFAASTGDVIKLENPPEYIDESVRHEIIETDTNSSNLVDAPLDINTENTDHFSSSPPVLDQELPESEQVLEATTVTDADNYTEPSTHTTAADWVDKVVSPVKVTQHAVPMESEEREGELGTSSVELYNEDFDVSTSEKAAFSEREIAALEMEMSIALPAEDEQLVDHEEHAHDESELQILRAETPLPDASSVQVSPSAPRSASPPLPSTDTITSSTIDDLQLSPTHESAASAVSTDWVSNIVSTASHKAFTALSPTKQKALAELSTPVDDTEGVENEFASRDEFETLHEAAVPTNTATDDTDGALAIHTESTDAHDSSDKPIEAVSPAASFVMATFLQAQANVSRPQSAVPRDPALTSTTLSDKMLTRPVSAKLAEAFVERSVSQARVNVVMGSPTRSPTKSDANKQPEERESSAESTGIETVPIKPVEAAVSNLFPTIEESEPLKTTESDEPHPSVLGIGESGMNDRLGSSSLVLEDPHSKSTKSVAYDDFLGTLGLATPSADSKKAAQLRAMVSETREGEVAAPAKKLTKREQQEADRTFLTSLQYHAPAQQTKKIVNSSSGPNIRPTSSKPALPSRPVTKRDLLRARSAGPNRHPSPERQAPPPKAAVPKRKALSPNHLRPPTDHRTKFVAPPMCLPSQMLPKDLLNYLFASDRESELHIARFCQHGKHFDSCRVELCVDAHEKYRWLNLTHQKAKDACELVSDADRMWREKLERALSEEIEEKKASLEAELSQLNIKLIKKHNSSVKLLKQGVHYYESILPALHKGKITPQELHKATGWTEEHYENFKRRLQSEEDRAHFKKKMKLDQQAHKNLEVLEQLKTSLSAPMMYLDGMLKHRLEKIHSAVKRIDLCFQYSIKLAIENGKGKSEEEIKLEKEARSPMRNAIVAERMQRNTKHGFEILKASLASIADVCSEVRVMYQGIKKDHDLKQEKRLQEATTGVPRSRSASPARRSPSPNERKSNKNRPKSAPADASPTRRKSSRPKSRGRSATHTEKSSPQGRSKPSNRMEMEPLERASKISYGEDFESHSILDEHDAAGEVAEDSIEIKEDTYDEQISDMMRDMMGVTEEDDLSRRPSKSSRASRDRARSGSGSIVEDSISDSASAQRPHSSAGASFKKNGGVRPFPSLTMSVGSGIDEFGSEVLPGNTVSEKGAVMARAKALALSRSPGGHNYAPDEEDEIASEVDDDIGFSNDPGDRHLKVSVSNMYDDDFEGGSELLRGSFSNKKSSSKKSTARKTRSTKQKVARLINTDPLGKPLANMKHTFMNDQSILHGILLQHNIPIHYTDEPEATAVHKLKPLIITNNLNQPVVLSLSSPTKLHSAPTARPKSAEPIRTSPLANPRASLIMASLRLPERLVRGTIRCYHCATLFTASDAKHIPTSAVSSDNTVFERAKARQKETGKLFPTYDKLQVTSNSDVQKQWIQEQQEMQQSLVSTPKAGDNKKASTTLQRFEHSFCSWECVKAWVHVNYPPHQRYQYDILIDATAAYTVQARV